MSGGSSSSGFIPVIFTKPPSGIAPTPYSVSPICFFTMNGGKNRPNRSTRMPTAFAATKWPNSCRMISAAKPANAQEPAQALTASRSTSDAAVARASASAS